jgi:hypothetical protein
MVISDRPYQIICAEYDGVSRELSPLAALLGEINLARRDPITCSVAARQLELFTAAREGKRKAKAADTTRDDAMIAALQQYLNGGQSI